jgi:gliding motility-associated lipoprotein GldH
LKDILIKVNYLLVLLLLFSACDPNRVYENNIHIADNSWDRNAPVNFEIPISDTINPHSIYFNIRHNTDYSYNNLFLFVDTYYPNGAHRRDTVECVLADYTGKWYGEGLGDIKENQILINRGVVFPMFGVYKFTLEQAMRTESLEGIEDIGIRIEKMQD